MADPAEYKQQRSYPALIGSGFVLLTGSLIVWGLLPAVKSGDVGFSAVWLVVCLSVCIAAILIVAAFVRHQFAHLWKHEDPAGSKRASEKRAEDLL
jgi:hypothetical protein